jgi:hypothetical protein
MFNDLDDSIKQLLITRVPLDSAEVGMSFEVPNREWAASQTKPSVNIYLYDIRENHELRSFEWNEDRKENISTKKKGPTRVDLSYLITVWSKHVADEHRLLGRIASALMLFPLLPEDILQGAIKELEYPIHASAGQPDGILKSPADFWTTMENQIKPSINYVVTIPMDLSVNITSPLVLTKVLDVKDKNGGAMEEMLQIGGTVYSKGKTDVGVPNALLLIKELNVTTTSDVNGKYKLSKIGRGNYTFRVSAPKKAVKEIAVVVPSDSYNIEI